MSHDHLKICHIQPSTKPALHGAIIFGHVMDMGGGGGRGRRCVEEGEEVLKVL